VIITERSSDTMGCILNIGVVAGTLDEHVVCRNAESCLDCLEDMWWKCGKMLRQLHSLQRAFACFGRHHMQAEMLIDHAC
jgi:hypothetical protein